ncbi:MAG: hypothetical protein ACXAC5_00870 [Promethearchaeota archaeon]|jgi:hypothetical protein
MKLSFIIAGIRTHNWLNIYESVKQTTTIEDFEVIFIGPYGLPQELVGNEHIRFIEDHGCPSRCTQLGLIHSRGEYVTWTADDGVFSPTMAVDKALDSIPKHKKGVVAFKYLEGNPNEEQAKNMLQDEFWRLGYHKFHQGCRFAPDQYVLIMIALIRRDYMIEIGGFDCRFEHSGIGAVDLAIRLQNDGAEVVPGEKLTHFSILRKRLGDHGPVHDAQTEHDQPLFQKIYNDEKLSQRTSIDPNNWEKISSRWGRRFGNV